MQSGIDHRRHRRYDLSIPVQFHSSGHVTPAARAASRDISAKGIYFCLSEGVDLGSELQWEILLPPELCQGQSVRVRCRGKIIRVDKPDSYGKIGVAASIEEYEFVRGHEL